MPEWAIRATVKVSDWHGNTASGGTGTIVDFDSESKTCLVMTCRHVVEINHGRIEVVTYDGIRLPARFVGVHETSTRGADITVLEIDAFKDGKNVIDTFVPISRTPLKKGDSICQVGWGGGHLNRRIGQFLGSGGFSGSGWRYHYNCEASFPAISGDSGSGIFSLERKELVGVLWGGGGGTSLFCGPEYIAQAYELCCKRRKRPGGGGGGVPSSPVPPGGPAKPEFPTEPGKPSTTPSTPTAPTVNLTPIMDSIGKLTEVAKLTNESVGKLGEKVSSIDSRLGVVEGKLAAQPANPPPSTTPSDCKDRMDKVQADLERLKQSLKQSGTIKISVVPK